MDHISANLAFGRREKNIWGTKSSRGGGQEAYKKNRKKVATFFFFVLFFGDSKNFVGGGKKISRGHQMVTLRHWDCN